MTARTNPRLSAVLLIAAGLCTGLSGCVTPVGPVEVTRFHAPDVSSLGKGPIAVLPGPGMDAASLELRSFQIAVFQELQRLGYVEAADGAAGGQIALITLNRTRIEPERKRSPVSVGLGGSAGSYGSGVGLGIGIDLSGKPAATVQTELAVTIRDKVSGVALWEGRASIAVSAKSPLADTQLAAPKLAAALFRGFPGNSGETIEVK